MDTKTIIAAAAIAFGVTALISQIDLRGGKSAPSVDMPGPGVAATIAATAATAATGASYAALLGDLDLRIEGLQKRANARADDWLIRAHLAGNLLGRASLSNQIDDFARVEAVLDDAFAIAVAGSGPVLVAARFNFAIHRLEAAEKYLDILDRRAVPRADDTLAARVLRAEIAVQRGQYEHAFTELTAVAAIEPASANVELALYHAKTGDPTKAEALLEAALASTEANDPRRRAWLRLQRGVLAMDRGDLQAALQHLVDADAELADWWLVQENIAEIHSRRDEHAEAVAIYEVLVSTVDLPQHMDALAALYRHKGEPEKAAELIARAAARWELQLAKFPESAMGHCLQHHLQFGTPERALELALANYATRPGGDAQVALARAYLQAGKPAEALAMADKALASPYRSARLHDVAAKAHAALGHTAAAEEQINLRLALNPRFSDNEHSH